jgi:hypothetical protein
LATFSGRGGPGYDADNAIQGLSIANSTGTQRAGATCRSNTRGVSEPPAALLRRLAALPGSGGLKPTDGIRLIDRQTGAISRRRNSHAATLPALGWSSRGRSSSTHMGGGCQGFQCRLSHWHE